MGLFKDKDGNKRKIFPKLAKIGVAIGTVGVAIEFFEEPMGITNEKYLFIIYMFKHACYALATFLTALGYGKRMEDNE